MSEDKVGHVEIQYLRGEFEDNYIVYVLTNKPIQHTGKFYEDDWDYAYSFLKSEDIEIRTIHTTRKLPKDLDVLIKAIHKVSPEDKFYAYKFILWSRLSKSDIKEIIEQWLKEELKTHRIFVDVIKLSKVTKRKRIPITKSMFEKMLKKIGERNG